MFCHQKIIFLMDLAQMTSNSRSPKQVTTADFSNAIFCVGIVERMLCVCHLKFKPHFPGKKADKLNEMLGYYTPPEEWETIVPVA
jgi:hypothetical protein